MSKLKRTFFILLLIAALLGAACIAAGAVLGAQPFQVGETILREAAERGTFDLLEGIRNLLGSSAALAA